MKALLVIITVFLYSLLSIAAGSRDDIEMRSKLKSECLYNKKFHIQDYKVTCEGNYHHYNSTGYKQFYQIQEDSIKIAEFNALHPGMDKSRFKDYEIIATMLNQYDLIAVTELIALTENDKKIHKFLNSVPKRIKKVQSQLKRIDLTGNITKKILLKRKLAIILLQKKIEQLREDFKIGTTYLAKPGYLKMLEALRGLPDGEHWALILSPRGEGSITTPTPELIGYYYRSSKVKPQVNKYCKSIKRFGRSAPFACIVNMDKDDLGSDKRDDFARRPFMAEFISGKFSFALLTSHILFESPKPIEVMQKMMQSAFGVNSYEDLGVGISKKNYARFAEIKHTLDFISKLKNNKQIQFQEDIIFLGDFNIQKKNKFWPTVLKSWPEAELYISENTSHKASRYYPGTTQETNGASSNYDHFIFDPKATKECLITGSNEINGGVMNFSTKPFVDIIDRKYGIRAKKGDNGTYISDLEKFYKIVKRDITPLENGDRSIKTVGMKKVRFNKISISTFGVIDDTKANEEYARYFYKRILKPQLLDKTYYGYTKQIISDHYPIFMECSTR